MMDVHININVLSKKSLPTCLDTKGQKEDLYQSVKVIDSTYRTNKTTRVSHIVQWCGKIKKHHLRSLYITWRERDV